MLLALDKLAVTIQVGAMPGAAHEILLLALREQPSLLATLLARLTGRPGPASLKTSDSTLRFADVKEVRPDLVLHAQGLPWIMLEVQHTIDEAKRRRWPLAVGVLLDEHRAMGELLVLTHRRRVARWAEHAVAWQGPYGTRLTLEPLVLWVNLNAAESLLREPEPELALVAAWALQGKCGPRSKALAVQAIERTASLPAPVRAQQGRAIMQLLGEPLRQYLHAMMLKDLDKVPQSQSFKKFLRSIEGPAEERGKAEGIAEGEVKGKVKGKAEGKAEGLRVAVLDACELLGIVLTEAHRAQLEAMGVAELEALRHELKQTRRWPGC